ncbi:S-adenosylmethionine decarboxylase [Nanoarchaeota archaeon]
MEETNTIAPEVFRQRFLIDLITDKKLDKKMVEDTLKDFVKYMGFQSYSGPMVYETGEVGKQINQGYDGFIALIDSGISINTWADSGLVSLYIHTCKEFSEEKALKFMQDYFKPKEIFSKTV